MYCWLFVMRLSNAEERGLMKIEVIEDPRLIGDLHYYVHVENEHQMELFLEDVPPNSKELIRDEGRFYDYFLEE